MGDPGDRTHAAPSGPPSVVDVAVVLLVKAAAGAAHLRAGFFAFSDDDFSRVVIAERFAAHAALDPSGTSWLPLPFWLTGGAMMALGRSLPVARAVAVVLGLAAALLVHRAARWAGASRAGAVVGAVLATTVPTAARLGVSFQPEALTAGLVVLGAASTQVAGSRRVTGAVALALACLSRYDAWPAAATFATLSAIEAVRARRGESASLEPGRTNASPAEPRTLVAAALVAVAAPSVWVLHGVLAHGDALFFVHRVAAYRHALGVTETWTASLLAYPVMLVTAEPELTLGAVAMLAVATLKRGRPSPSLARPAVVLASVLAFLVVGRLMDGAPTHHAERTLLPLWAGLAIAAAEAGVSAQDSGLSPAFLAAPILAAAAGVAIRLSEPAPSLSARAAERAIGEAARDELRGFEPGSDGARGSAPRELVLIDTQDYGYFAVMAAFGAPERAAPFDSRDPRDPPKPDAFLSVESLKAHITEEGATALVVEREHWQAAAAVGHLVATRSNFALVKLR